MSTPNISAFDRPLIGIAWAIAAVFTASLLLALPRLAGGDLSPYQLTLLRYLTGFVTIAPIFLFVHTGVSGSGHGPAPKHALWLHALRAFLAVARISCFFYAVTHMPFANAQAIILTNGVFMIAFAAIFLGEKVRLATTVAAAVCFTGAVIVAEPNWEQGGFLSLGALGAIAGAAFWGIEATVIRYTAMRDNAVRIVFSVNLIALILIAVPGYLVWISLTAEQWMLLAAIGPLAIMTQISNVKAFRAANANLLAPFRYISVVFALAIGWFVFGEWPSVWAGMGIAMILISGIALALNVGSQPSRIA